MKSGVDFVSPSPSPSIRRLINSPDSNSLLYGGNDGDISGHPSQRQQNNNNNKTEGNGFLFPSPTISIPGKHTIIHFCHHHRVEASHSTGTVQIILNHDFIYPSNMYDHIRAVTAPASDAVTWGTTNSGVPNARTYSPAVQHR